MLKCINWLHSLLEQHIVYIVYSFLRLSRSLYTFAARALFLLTTNFYDDYILASRPGSVDSARNSMDFFFPRASERRVLPIVGVCISSSHLLIFTPSHLHTFSSSHLPIFTPSHLHIFSSSHLLTSHLLIFTSSHLPIFSSSHLLIFTSSHLQIFSSSHLLIFTASHLHIFTSSHLLIFISSHLHIFKSSYLHIFSSCPLALSFFSISLLKPTGRHETQPFRTKRGSIAKN